MRLPFFSLLLFLLPTSLRATHAHSPPRDPRRPPHHTYPRHVNQDLSAFDRVPQHPHSPFYQPSPAHIASINDALANISKADAQGTAKNPVSAQATHKASTFSPINPPSIPIAVKSPYLNAWAPSGSLLSVTPPNSVGNGGYLAGQDLSFWTSSYGANGDYRLGWNGFIRIDNTTFQYMGDSCGTTVAKCQNARQVSMTYTATRTIFDFEAAGVDFTVTFLTTVTPDDYLRQSLPLSYMQIAVDRSTVGSHTVQIYSDIDERWVTGHDYDYANYNYQMKFTDNNDGVALYEIARNSPQVYTEYRQRAEWGSVVFATRNQTNLSSRNNNNVVAQNEFLKTGKLTYDHYGVGGPDNSFAFALDFTDKNNGDDAVFAIGHLRTPMVNYIRAMPGSNGQSSYQQDRYGYWMSKYPKFADAAAFFINDFDDALAGAKVFDAKIEKESRAVVGGGKAGAEYAAITQLSVRQALATIEITVPYDEKSGKYDTSDTLIFLKEISSNGDMQTVDVFFPLFPLLTYLNPDLLRDVMLPIFEYNESGLYPNKWCSHDLGTYPNAYGHNDGNDEPMQVEESGNMILMTAHWAQMVGKEAAVPFLKDHYAIMAQWTEFLITDSLIPASQLSTDDFAGVLANQTNLALKGLEGIAAMGTIAEMLGKKAASKYRKTAAAYAAAWQNYSMASTRTHLKLAYQSDQSWGTLYNLFGDRLLNLQLIPKSIYDMQDKYYPTVAIDYGLPLDSRHNWTKSDWTMFTSAISASPSTSKLLIKLLHKFLSNGRTDSPMTDLYEASTGDTPKEPFDPNIHFLARPVVGGHFMHLALAAADAKNNISATNPYKYGPETDGTHHEQAMADSGMIAQMTREGKWSQLATEGDRLVSRASHLEDEPLRESARKARTPSQEQYAFGFA